MNPKQNLALFVAFSLLGTLLTTGCEANGPPISHIHPEGRRELVRIVPECRHPSSTRYAACLKSAEMLEAPDAPHATELYIKNWEHQLGHKAVRSAPRTDGYSSNPGGSYGGSHHGSGLSGGDCNPGGCNLGSGGGGGGDAAAVLLIAVAVVIVVVVAVVAVKAAEDAAHDARVTAAGRITTRVLHAIYEQSRDAYAAEMLGQLEQVRFTDTRTLDNFASAHDQALANRDARPQQDSPPQ